MSAAPVEKPSGSSKVVPSRECEVDPRLLDHPGELACRQDGVDRRAAVDEHLGPRDLELLRGARHDGDDEHLLRVDGLLLRPVGLREGAEHHVRRLARGEVRELVRELVLDVLDPARRAGGDHREDDVLPADRGERPVEELGPLLEDRQVGGEVRVEDVVEAEEAEGMGHLPRHDRPRLHAEHLAERDADGRGGLDDGADLRIEKGVPDGAAVDARQERPDGADHDALAAVGAVAGAEREVGGGADRGAEAAVVDAEDADALDLAADRDAAPAEDALRGVAVDGGARGVDEVLRLLPLEAAVGDLDLLAQLLELAVLVPVAGEAVARVVGEHQLVEHLARLLHARGVRLHDHPVADGDRAGGLEAPHPLDLDDADAAGADLVDAFEVAEVRDLDAVVLGRLEDRPVALGPHGLAVDDEVNGVRHGFLPTAGRSGGSAWPRRWRSACGIPRRPPGSPSSGSRVRGSASGTARARRRRSRRWDAGSGSPRPC